MTSVYKGDCLELMPGMEKNSIDLILTDPPYMISRETNFSKGGGDQQKYGSISMNFGNGIQVKELIWKSILLRLIES